MNQILYKCFKEEIKPTKKKKFLIIFIIAIILIICTIIFYIFIKYKLHVNENISKNILNNYKIMTLYSNTIDNYNSEKLLQNDESQPFVIGLIQIEKIGLTYPILSSTNEELLKISPCRFLRTNAK